MYAANDSIERRNSEVKKMSKLMALLLVVVMVVMLVPVSAFAAEKVKGEEQTSVVLVVEGTSADGVVTPATTPTTTPAAATPAATTPAATTPAATTPAATTPAVETPVATTPAVETPAVTTPAVETPAATTPAVETPAVTTAAAPVVETKAVDEGTIEVKAVPALGLWRDSVTFIDVLLNAVGADYSYDAITNALTLNNFVGKQVVAADMGSNFAMILKGENVIANGDGCAVDVWGNLTMSGDGELYAIGDNRAIHVIGGDLTINSGDYDLFAGSTDSNAYGIDVANGDLTINGGYVDATVYATGNNGAYGLWADNDVTVNCGDIDVITESVNGPSMGIGAGDDAIFKGGYTTVDSNTETGVATALFAGSWVVIKDGILDLTATGGVNPLAIYGGEGVYIDPCYGNVDLTASSLYLEKGHSHWKHQHATSSNPKTGTQDMAQEALMATMGLLALLGMAYLISRKESME
jgi:hypothetical protein